MDAPPAESNPPPKPRPEKPKTMPPSKDWMGHQRMTDGNGNVVRCEPQFSQWFTSYLCAPALEGKKFHTKFRHRFRMEHSSFLKLLHMVKDNKCFSKRARKTGPTGPSPVGLLLLGSLCYLGRGWTFDCLEEQTSISREVHTGSFSMPSSVGHPPHSSMTWSQHHPLQKTRLTVSMSLRLLECQGALAAQTHAMWGCSTALMPSDFTTVASNSQCPPGLST